MKFNPFKRKPETPDMSKMTQEEQLEYWHNKRIESEKKLTRINDIATKHTRQAHSFFVLTVVFVTILELIALGMFIQKGHLIDSIVAALLAVGFGSMLIGRALDLSSEAKRGREIVHDVDDLMDSVVQHVHTKLRNTEEMATLVEELEKREKTKTEAKG